jgi:serine/threonine-protein phosphatase 2B catalytic subunit
MKVSVCDIRCLYKIFRFQGRLAEPTWRHLLLQARSLFRREPNIIRLPRGCTIVGDTHGQYYDLLTIFELGGPLNQQTYVFLGDYVDRGSFSCECLFLLLALKINYPQSFILLRGNHESRQMTQVFTYKKECQVKYSLDLWNESMSLFDCLPICALIDDRFLCMHGGISPHLKSLNDIEKLNRFQELPSDGPLCDLMWSDPHRQFNARETPPWIFNTTRNCSFFFNYKACENFLIENRLLSVIRAHEVVPNGLLFYEQGSMSQFPVLISLFSAPNYCDVYNNTAALIIYDHQRNFRPIHFRQQPHPFVLPNHENAFEFGHRLMKTYVHEIILALIHGYTELADRSPTSESNDDVTKRLRVKKQMLNEHTHKCRRMNKMNIQLGNLTPSEQLQEKALNNQTIFEQEAPLLSKSMLENDLSLTFDSASKIDALYEERIY